MFAFSFGVLMFASDKNRAIFFWDVREIQVKGRKSIRINVEFDHATHILWSPDERAIVIHKFVENCIEVYKIEKKKDGLPLVTNKAFVFDQVHTESVVGFGIACNGRFMMSCSNNNDIVIWSLKGEQMAQIDTYMMSTVKAKVSPCARYVVASGFIPDVRIWEVFFDKSGKFKKVVRAFELTGHSSGVYDFAFDAGTSHIATVSKDGTWRLYGTNVDYARGEIVQLVSSGIYSQASGMSIIALSPNANILIIGTGNSMEIFKAKSGELIETIDKIFYDDITNIRFHPSGKHIFVTGDNKIKIFSMESLEI